MTIYQEKEYLKNMFEKISKYIIDKYDLHPNFDIIEFLNKIGIETIGVEDIQNYGLSFEDDSCKIYYQTDLELMNKKEKILSEEERKHKDIMQRDTRFVLAMALGDILLLSRNGEGNLKEIPYKDKIIYKGISESSLSENWILQGFAASFLMQEVSFNIAIELIKYNKPNIDPLEELSNEFGVTYHAVNCKCKSLGYRGV